MTPVSNERDRAMRGGMDCNYPECGCDFDSHCSDAPALRSQTPEPSSSVRVKPLQWPDEIKRGQRVMSGYGLIQYTIAHYGGSDPSGGTVYRWAAQHEGWRGPLFSYEDAIAAAQADYERRVLYVLEAPTVSPAIEQGEVKRSQPVTGEEVETIWADMRLGIWLGADQPDRKTPPVPFVRRSAYQALKAERDEAFAANERDRSIIAEARAAFNAALERRSWLLDGRGSYEWDDDRWKDEFAEAIKELRAPLDALNKIGIDWSLCPITPEEIAAARIDWKARAEAAEARLSAVEEWRDARAAFLALPAGSPDVRQALDRLASAEDALYRKALTTITGGENER